MRSSKAWYQSGQFFAGRPGAKLLDKIEDFFETARSLSPASQFFVLHLYPIQNDPFNAQRKAEMNNCHPFRWYIVVGLRMQLGVPWFSNEHDGFAVRQASCWTSWSLCLSLYRFPPKLRFNLHTAETHVRRSDDGRTLAGPWRIVPGGRKSFHLGKNSSWERPRLASEKWSELTLLACLVLKLTTCYHALTLALRTILVLSTNSKFLQFPQILQWWEVIYCSLLP